MKERSSIGVGIWRAIGREGYHATQRFGDASHLITRSNPWSMRFAAANLNGFQSVFPTHCDDRADCHLISKPEHPPEFKAEDNPFTISPEQLLAR